MASCRSRPSDMRRSTVRLTGISAPSAIWFSTATWNPAEPVRRFFRCRCYLEGKCEVQPEGGAMVRIEYIKSDCRLIASVHCKDISSNDGINDVFNELNIALTKIQEKIGIEEPPHSFFLIDIVVKGAP